MLEIDDLHPGDPEKIANYRVVRRLGAGGQGVVYLAIGPSGEQVAIKQLRANLEGDQAKELFAKEVAAARLVAPFCTARVLGAQLEGPSPYIVSEYIEGPSLQQYVQRHGPMKGVELERLAIGTATALAAIHQAGVVHRDFKPANVMLAEAGPRVIDFGIARDMSTETTLTNRVFGTPAYMAPEQLRDERVGPATDMFAWGSVIAYAATGRTPFEAPNMIASILRITNEQPDLTGVPTELLDVLRTCLSKDPAHRPTAQQALARLLGRPAPTHDMADATVVLAEAAGLVQARNMVPAAEYYRLRSRSAAYPPAQPPSNQYAIFSGPATRPSRNSGRGRVLAAAAVVLILLLAAWVRNGPASDNQSNDSADGTPISSTSSPQTTDPQVEPAATPSTRASSQATTPAAPAVKAVKSGGSGKESIPAIFDGDWEGQVFQAFGTTNLWTAKVSLNAGDTTGTFRMDELDCSGQATVKSADDSTLVLRVVINDDPDNACASRGTVHLILITHNRATISWQEDNDASRLANGFAKRS